MWQPVPRKTGQRKPRNHCSTIIIRPTNQTTGSSKHSTQFNNYEMNTNWKWRGGLMVRRMKNKWLRGGPVRWLPATLLSHYDSEQAVYTHSPIAVQCNLVPAKEWWCFFEGLLGLTESGNSLALRLWPKSTVSWLHALDQYQLILSREITDVIGKAVKRYWRLHQTCEVLCVLHDAALAVYRLRPDVPPQAAGSQSSRPADSVAQYQLQRPD